MARHGAGPFRVSSAGSPPGRPTPITSARPSTIRVTSRTARGSWSTARRWPPPGQWPRWCQPCSGRPGCERPRVGGGVRAPGRARPGAGPGNRRIRRRSAADGVAGVASAENQDPWVAPKRPPCPGDGVAALPGPFAGLGLGRRSGRVALADTRPAAGAPMIGRGQHPILPSQTMGMTSTVDAQLNRGHSRPPRRRGGHVSSRWTERDWRGPETVRVSSPAAGSSAGTRTQLSAPPTAGSRATPGVPAAHVIGGGERQGDVERGGPRPAHPEDPQVGGASREGVDADLHPVDEGRGRQEGPDAADQAAEVVLDGGVVLVGESLDRIGGRLVEGEADGAFPAPAELQPGGLGRDGWAQLGGEAVRSRLRPRRQDIGRPGVVGDDDVVHPGGGRRTPSRPAITNRPSSRAPTPSEMMASTCSEAPGRSMVAGPTAATQGRAAATGSAGAPAADGAKRAPAVPPSSSRKASAMARSRCSRPVAVASRSPRRRSLSAPPAARGRARAGPGPPRAAGAGTARGQPHRPPGQPAGRRRAGMLTQGTRPGTRRRSRRR